jgi:hypothetical protein
MIPIHKMNQVDDYAYVGCGRNIAWLVGIVGAVDAQQGKLTLLRKEGEQLFFFELYLEGEGFPSWLKVGSPAKTLSHIYSSNDEKGQPQIKLNIIGLEQPSIVEISQKLYKPGSWDDAIKTAQSIEFPDIGNMAELAGFLYGKPVYTGTKDSPKERLTIIIKQGTTEGCFIPANILGRFVDQYKKQLQPLGALFLQSTLRGARIGEVGRIELVTKRIRVAELGKHIKHVPDWLEEDEAEYKLLQPQ